MATKKKKPSGNPASKTDPLTVELFSIVKRSVEAVHKLQGDPRITKEQWEWFRGAARANIAVYAILLGREPSFTVNVDDKTILTTEVYGIVRRSVEITQKLQDDPRITQEQWEWFRGGVLASMSIYGILLGKDPAFTIIIDEYDRSMLCPTCAGPNRTVKGIECPTCGCPPRD